MSLVYDEECYIDKDYKHIAEGHCPCCSSDDIATLNKTERIGYNEVEYHVCENCFTIFRHYVVGNYNYADGHVDIFNGKDISKSIAYPEAIKFKLC